VLASPTVLINPTGYLWGTGLIQGTVTNFGAIAPGNSPGTLRVQGGLVFMPGSVYLAEIAANGQSDRIRVDGPVTLNGGWVRTSQPQALYRDRFAWSLLSATGGVTGAMEGVDGQPNSQTFSLHVMSSSNALGLEVWRRPFASFGAGPGGQGLGAGLDGLVNLAVPRQDDMAGLLCKMDWSYGRAQIQSALDRLSPEIYTSFAAAGLEGTAIFDRALARRMDEVRLAAKLDLAEAPAGEGLLMAAADEAAPLADTQAGGAVDPGTQGWNFWGGGLGVGASKSTLDWGRSYLSGGMKGLHTGLYAGAEVGGLYGQASAAYSQYEADGRRDIDLPEVDPLQASADFKAQAGLASLSGGYDYRLDGWLLGPTIGLRYGRFQQDGFGESGAGFAGLKVDEAQNDSLTSTLGLQAATKLEWRGMEVMPRLTLEWRHEYQNREPEITARFAGYEDAPFRATGPAPVADLVVMQAGLTARVRERFSAFVDCSLDLGQDYSAQAVSLGLQYSY
jgi:uncharacterized protein with beta-barrel porin domain